MQTSAWAWLVKNVHWLTPKVYFWGVRIPGRTPADM
jgi:hypothetical protein